MLNSPYGGSAYQRLYPVLLGIANDVLFLNDPYITSLRENSYLDFNILAFIYFIFKGMVVPENFYYYISILPISLVIGALVFVTYRATKSKLGCCVTTLVLILQRYVGFDIGDWWALRFEYTTEGFSIASICLAYYYLHKRNRMAKTLTFLSLGTVLHPSIGFGFGMIFIAVKVFRLDQPKAGSTLARLCLSVIAMPIALGFALLILDRFYALDIATIEFYRYFALERHAHHFSHSWGDLLSFYFLFLCLMFFGLYKRFLNLFPDMFFALLLICLALSAHILFTLQFSKVLLIAWPPRCASIYAGGLFAYLMGLWSAAVWSHFQNKHLSRLRTLLTPAALCAMLVFLGSIQHSRCRETAVVLDTCRGTDLRVHYAEIANYLVAQHEPKGTYLVSDIAYFRALGYSVHSGSVFWFSNPLGWIKNLKNLRAVDSLEDARELVPSSFSGNALFITRRRLNFTEEQYFANGLYFYKL
jgi:hypothetical protein